MNENRTVGTVTRRKRKSVRKKSNNFVGWSEHRAKIKGTDFMEKAVVRMVKDER